MRSLLIVTLLLATAALSGCGPITNGDPHQAKNGPPMDFGGTGGGGGGGGY